MDESILNALMQLFAVGAILRSDQQDITYSRQIIHEYLNRRLNKDLTQKYLDLYDSYVKSYLSEFSSDKRRKKRLSVYFVKVLKIAEHVNETLEHLEKIIVLIRLIEFFQDQVESSDEVKDFVSTVANIFNIDSKEYLSIEYFVLDKFDKIPAQDNLLYILPENNKPQDKSTKFLTNKGLDKPIIFLFIPSIERLIFKYLGSLTIKLTSRNIEHNLVYLFDSGAIIRGSKINPIYQTQIIRHFLSISSIEKVNLVAHNIEFYYPNSENGIHKFSFDAESGQMIGILGASGAGKSTLLSLLIGKYRLSSGQITINGHDLYKERDLLIPLIGYVPQDDLLIEELTVYQNLFYNAKLCFGKKDDQEIRQIVDDVLKKLDLYEIKDLKVGNPLNKYISGGQRKRLNIALELIREPSILFVDEPTSGLSSMDSENVMHLLKRQAINGRIVIVNIHQPSSDIFKLFDEIIILDKGGYPVYKGNPLDGVIYFKQIANYADSDVAECPTCGNVNPDLILEIIEDKMVNEFGRYTQVRKTSPKEWYILYRVNLEIRDRTKAKEKVPLPKKEFSKPSLLKQFWIFFNRDILSKLADKQYMLINLLESPLLALILAFFVRTPNEDGKYIFMSNHNLPIFLFMASIVAIFLGLSLSAEEIIKDRKILERERFLQLSRFSYLNSKVLIMVLFSIYQTFTFVIIANWILAIHGMLFKYWIILFFTALASNMLGLLLSSALDSIVAVYITIPLIIVPQMLLGGLMINFDDLPTQLTNKKYTPLIADIMFSRWSYEAMAVVQFRDNYYERNFFDIDKQRSDAIYYSSFYVPEMTNLIQKAVKAKQQGLGDVYQFYRSVIQTEFYKIAKMDLPKEIKFKHTNYLNDTAFIEHYQTLIKYLTDLQRYYNILSNKISSQKDKIITQLEQQLGQDGLMSLKKNNYNKKLADIVLNRNRVKQIILYNGELIRKKDPIFMTPYSHIGRAQFYAPFKFIGNKKIDTFVFDNFVMLLMSLLLYIALYYDWLRKFIQLFSRHRIPEI